MGESKLTTDENQFLTISKPFNFQMLWWAHFWTLKRKRKEKFLLFIHGSFWHCPICRCVDRRMCSRKDWCQVSVREKWIIQKYKCWLSHYLNHCNIYRDITEEIVEKGLFTHVSSAPNVLVRASGEIRFSDFMLWQANYTSLKFITERWPEMTNSDMVFSVLEYQQQHVWHKGTNKIYTSQNSIKNIENMEQFTEEYETKYRSEVIKKFFQAFYWCYRINHDPQT